jgi:hypothetical protein
VTEADLPGVIERLKTKLAAPRYRTTAGELWGGPLDFGAVRRS